MKNLQLILISVLTLLIASCKTDKKEENDVKAIVARFAELECRAVSLREKRFELANQMRFTQDTLMRTPAPQEASRLKLKLEAFNKDKEALVAQSLALADSIKNSLGDLMKNNFKTEQDKRVFDDMLNKTLIERGCVDRS
jgi:hypothetical protein